jgi:hypothetical protein
MPAPADGSDQTGEHLRSKVANKVACSLPAAMLAAVSAGSCSADRGTSNCAARWAGWSRHPSLEMP